MTTTDPAVQQGRIIDALEPLQGGFFHLSPKRQEAIAGCLTEHLLPQYRRDVLNEAIEAARDQYLSEEIDNPEDEAYQHAVSHVIAAIGALLEGK
jgi:hypothetical protein